MSRSRKRIVALGALCVMCAAGARADDKSEYQHRVVAQTFELFRELDRNGDRTVTLDEARGALNFQSRFDDMDVNRDGRVTMSELESYLDREYGLPLPLR